MFLMGPPSSQASLPPSALRCYSSSSSSSDDDDDYSSAEQMTPSSSDRWEIDSYYSTVDELQKTLSGSTLSCSSSLQPSTPYYTPVEMAVLEDEFRSMLTDPRNSILDLDCFLVDVPQDEHVVAKNRNEERRQQKVHDFDGERQIEHLSSSCSASSSVSSGFYKSIWSIQEVDLIPADVVRDLRSIARRMIAANCLHECVQIYASARKSAIETTLHWFNLTKLSIGDMQQLPWDDALQKQIRRWIRAAKACVRFVFPSEHRLCKLLFQGIDSSSPTSYLDDDDDCGGVGSSPSVDSVAGLGIVGDMCFAETVKGPATQLLSFAELISIGRQSPEKLFMVLDLHDAFSDILPDIEKVFKSESCESIRLQATETLSRLTKAARGILSEFENLVLHEPSKVPVPGGTIHPLTRYVMNYISFISDYKQTLTKLIVSKPSKGAASHPDVDLAEAEGKSSMLALHLIWIISALTNNLECKSKHYKDPSLAHLFTLNNVHYIVHKIKSSPELRVMIGDNYLRKMTVSYRASATEYQWATWAGVLHCLREEGLHVEGGMFSAGVSKTALKERFKAFNSMLEEVRRTQAAWLVPDCQLREELRIFISEYLIPAYRSFLGRYGDAIQGGKNRENYVTYSAEDLDGVLLDLFEGSPFSQKSKPRYQ